MALARRPALTIGRYPLIICYAICIHFVWALGMFLDPDSAHATAPALVLYVVQSPLLGSVLLFLVAGAAFAGLMERRRVISALLMLPQQFMLTLAALGAVRAIVIGQFADGTIRSHWFIAVDQIPAVSAVVFHTIAILVILGARQKSKVGP